MPEGAPRDLDAARRELLRRRKAAREREARRAPTIPRAPADTTLLSTAQERFWFLQQLEPASAEYNVAGALVLRGDLDGHALRRAFELLVERHASLRTAFPALGGVPRQVVASDAELDFASEDVRPQDRDGRLERFALAPFDLTRAPLLRALHLRLAPDEHVVAACMHHIVTDGWSVRTIQRELPALYAAALGRGELPPAAPIAYVDYAAWQRERIDGERAGPLLDHWRRALDGHVGGVSLPLDHPRPPLVDRAGASHAVTLAPDVVGDLRELARGEGTTFFVVLQATFAALLHRLGGDERIAIGTSWAGRERRETEDIVGAFINTLALPSRVEPADTFRSFLGRAKASFRDAVAHAELPFERLVAELAPIRDPARTPLVDVFFDLGVPRPPAPWPDLEVGELPIDTGLAQFDLALAIVDDGAGPLTARFEYRSALFEPATIEGLAQSWLRLAAAVCAAPAAPLASLPLMDARERAAALALGRARREPDDAPANARDRVAAIAAAQPDAPAVVSANGESTGFAALVDRAQRWAGALVAAGVEPGAAVAVLAPRSERTPVALLAAWQAGATYIPLDPSDPTARRAAALAAVGARVVLVEDATETGATNTLAPADLDAGEPLRRPAPIDLDDVAFTVFTSGSTGEPKGVEVPHRALANLLDAGRALFAFSARDRFLLRTPTTFDASVWELVQALTHGAPLVVAPEGTERDPEALMRLARARGATVLQTVPSMLRTWVDSGALRGAASLRHLVCGGEALPAELATRALDQLDRSTTLWNLYGPSEACIEVTAKRCERGRLDRATVSIGRPLEHVQAHLLDPRGEPVPPFAVGELWLGGPCLARGYAGAPERTAAAFAPDPLGSGRLYRTGDLARRRPEGELEFVGRVDAQVKVAGRRVELEEIEAVLAEDPTVRECAADVRGGRLVAWVAGVGSAIDVDRLRRAAAERLPAALVPAAIGVVDRLPRTASEKLDRRALADPSPVARSSSAPPRGELEQSLAADVAAVLGVEAVGRDNDFFELGGQSLLAAELAVRVRERTGVPIELLPFFERPTVAGLAGQVRERSGDRAAPSKAHQPALSFAQERLWILDQLEPGSTHYNVLGGLRLDGSVDLDALESALGDIAARHAVWRAHFDPSGPRPLPVVDSEWRPTLERHDTSGAGDPEAAALALVEGEARHRFDLARGPLVRTLWIALAPDAGWLLLHQHHAVTDGASLAILADELGRAYRARVRGTAPAFGAPAANYFELAARQRAALDAGRRAELVEAAREELTDANFAPDLPLARPLPARRDHRGASLAVELDQATSDRVRQRARERGTTPFAVLLANFAVVLRRLTGDDDFVVGTAVANRSAPGADALLGLFVNAVPIRATVDGGRGFDRAVDGTTAALRRALARADLPFESLVEALAPERSPSRAPLFQVSFDTLGAAEQQLDFGSVAATELEFPTRTAKLDLSIAIDERSPQFKARIEFATDRFDRRAIERLWAYFARLLAGGLAAPERAVDRLELLDGSERRALQELGDGGDAPFDPAGLAHRLVAAAVDPTRSALVEGERRWSFAELDRVVRAAAASLARRGVEVGDRIALELERSLERTALMLAAWRCGAAWIALDPRDPAERRARTAERTQVALRVNESLARELCAESDGAATSPDRCDLDRPAYVIATSGTTGEPKLAVVPHRALANHVQQTVRLYDLGPTDCVVHRIPATFDAALLEWLPALAAGATVHLADAGEGADPARYLERAARARATVLVGVPAWIEALVADRERARRLTELRLILCGGEAMGPELPRRVAELDPAVALYNLYGPAETCIDATRQRCGAAAEAPPLGRPFPGTRLDVVDRLGQLVPRGIVGELAIGGRGVGLGYLGQAELTAARFEVGERGERRYRSGDLVRWRDDDALEFVGRTDREVKVAGRRVDPGAVESILASHPHVTEVAVTARDFGSARRLVAHVVGVGWEREQLVARIAARLPEACVPAAWDALDALPRLDSGKLDLRALAERPVTAGPRGEVAPRNEREAAIAGVVARVLGLDSVGITDDFFDLGGSSLAAIDLALQLREELELELDLPAFMAAPSVAAIATAEARPDTTGSTTGPEQLRAAARLPADIVVAARARPHPPREVLLTGATGFLGAHLAVGLLDAGVERVHAVARASDRAAAGERVRANLERYRLDPARFGERLAALRGDLAEPGLGLVEPLPRGCDAVVHCGAAVDFLADYSALEAANVGGTREALRLAAGGGLAFHFISTIGVAAPANLGARDRVDEDGSLDALIEHVHGYEQTKWVAEALVRAAGERGLPVAIHRPGRVAGSAATGLWNIDDFAARAIRGSLQLGLAPDIPLPIDVTPVDVLARAIAQIVVGARATGRTYHLLHPQPTRFDAIFRRAIERGAALEPVDPARWREAALAAARADRDHVLFPLLANLLAAHESGDDRDLVPDRDLPRLSRRNVEAIGAIEWPPVDRTVLDRWLDALGASAD